MNLLYTLCNKEDLLALNVYCTLQEAFAARRAMDHPEEFQVREWINDGSAYMGRDVLEECDEL